MQDWRDSGSTITWLRVFRRIQNAFANLPPSDASEDIGQVRPRYIVEWIITSGCENYLEKFNVARVKTHN